MEATEATFDAAVVERSHDVPVVVDFWATWCGPCLALTPVLEEAIGERGGAVELARVDVDANPGLSERFGVRGIPAVKAFRDGRVVEEFTGALSPVAVAAFLDRVLAPPRADALVEELRASGELPELVAALDAGDREQALSCVVAAVVGATEDDRDRLRVLAVAIFELLGQDDPLVATFRRRMATALY